MSDDVKKIKNREELGELAEIYQDINYALGKTKEERNELNASIKHYMLRKIKADNKGVREFKIPNDKGKVIVKRVPKIEYDESQIEGLPFFDQISVPIPAHRKFSLELFKEAIKNNALSADEIKEFRECMQDNGYYTLSVKSEGKK